MSDENAADEERSALVREHEVKKATVLFMAAATILELVSVFICIAVLFIAAVFVEYRLFGAATPAPMQLSSPVIFIGGLVAGYKIYKKVMRLAIDRLNLKDSLRPDVYDQYLTKEERRALEELR